MTPGDNVTTAHTIRLKDLKTTAAPSLIGRVLKSLGLAGESPELTYGQAMLLRIASFLHQRQTLSDRHLFNLVDTAGHLIVAAGEDLFDAFSKKERTVPSYLLQVIDMRYAAVCTAERVVYDLFTCDMIDVKEHATPLETVTYSLTKLMSSLVHIKPQE